LKAEKYYGENFFWVLCGIPEPDEKDQTFKYFIIPSKEMSQNVRASFELWKEKLGMKGQKHNPENSFRGVLLPPKPNRNGWDISPYLNRWDLIENKLT